MSEGAAPAGERTEGATRSKWARWMSCRTQAALRLQSIRRDVEQLPPSTASLIRPCPTTLTTIPNAIPGGQMQGHAGKNRQVPKAPKTKVPKVPKIPKIPKVPKFQSSQNLLTPPKRQAKKLINSGRPTIPTAGPRFRGPVPGHRPPLPSSPAATPGTD